MPGTGRVAFDLRKPYNSLVDTRPGCEQPLDRSSGLSLLRPARDSDDTCCEREEPFCPSRPLS
jgi:hypothetical protein